MNCIHLTSLAQQLLLAACLGLTGNTSPIRDDVSAATTPPTMVATSPGLGTLFWWSWAFFG